MSSLRLIVMLAVSVSLSPSVLGSDTFSSKDIIKQQSKYAAKKANSAYLHETRIQNSTVIHEVIAFYQPSYFEQFSEYDGYRRIEQMVAKVNSVYVSQDIDAKLVLVNIEKVSSVEDTVQFQIARDENGEMLIRGALSRFSGASLNSGSPEYDIDQKWQADHIAYIRPLWGEDGSIRGTGSTGFGFLTVLDDNTDRTLSATFAHEIGHNLRANHEIADTEGYEIEDAHAIECSGKRTIMYSIRAISNTEPVFSSPDISIEGQPCGVEGEANNLRVVKEGVIEAAAWKPGVASKGQVTFSAMSYAVDEGSELAITLVRDGDISQEASVKVFTENGSALWGEDFLDTYKEIVFTEGEAEATASFYFIKNNNSESAEEMSLVLRYPYKLSVLDDTHASVTINNINGPDFTGNFELSTSNDTFLSESDVTNFTISRTSSVDGDAVILLKSNSISARSPDDYVVLNRPILFKQGESEKNFQLFTVDDVNPEPTETFDVQIEATNEAQLNSASVSLTLFDNDSISAGQVDLRLVNVSAVLEGSSVDALLTRTLGFLGDINGNIEATYGGLLPNSSTNFTIAEGQDSTTVRINISNNTTIQGATTATLTLTTTTQTATLGTSTASFSITEDDREQSDSDSGGGSIGFLILPLAFLAFMRRFKILIPMSSLNN